MPNDWRTGYRGERFEYRLLRRADLSPMGVADGVRGCSVSGSIDSDIRWTGKLSWSGKAGATRPGDGDTLVQPWYIVDGAGEWPLCPPCYVSAPATSYSDTVPTMADMQLYDTTYTLAKRLKSPSPVTYAAGIVPATVLAARLTAAGVPRWSVTPSALVTGATLNYETGDSELKICNGLAGLLGYWAVHADMSGAMVAEPYTAPALRDTVWTFGPGDLSIIVAERTRKLDDFDVPNRITGVRRVDPAVTPTPVTVTLDSIAPTSRYTYAARGYWVDAETVKDADAADDTVLTRILARKLRDGAQVAATMQVKHAWIPEVGLGSVVAYHDTTGTTRWSVQSMALDADVGLLVSATWREVIG